MEALIPVLIVIIVAASLIWLINQIPVIVPPVNWILITIVVITAIIRLWPLL